MAHNHFLFPDHCLIEVTTNESERSCIYVLQVPVPSKVSSHVFTCYRPLIEVPVPREVSGHVFTCYMSFDWTSCTKGSGRSCIYVIQVFWLKWLYQGKWAVMYLRVTGLLIEVPVRKKVNGHVFTCYRSFYWTVSTKGSEQSCIYVLQIFWLKCMYQRKWAVMYLRVTCLLIEVPVPREVSSHVFTCYRSFDWSACTKGSERSCIYVLQVL